MQSLPRGLSGDTALESEIVVPHDTSVVPVKVVTSYLFEIRLISENMQDTFKTMHG